MKVFPRAHSGYVLSLALCALLLVALALPAAAARPAGKGKPAKADKASTTQVTEDNDTNDGDTPNNVVDDGDNRHPSGKDKSVENGNSRNQGNSTSDPDDDGRGPDRSNGGADKPDGPGGVDLADQDGNNGCGNDDDFEDDNEGWCGGKPKPQAPAEEPKPEPGETCADGSDAVDCEETDEPSCTPGTVGCDSDTDEPSCTPGTVGCDSDTDEPSCTPGTVGCDSDTDEPSCTPGTVGCDDSDSCSVDVPECTGGTDTDTDTDVDIVETPGLDDGGGDLDGDEALGSEGEVEGETGVAGVVIERDSASPARVLGGNGALASGLGRVSGAAATVLAATGLPTVILGLLALAGIGTGAGLVRRNRKP